MPATPSATSKRRAGGAGNAGDAKRDQKAPCGGFWLQLSQLGATGVAIGTPIMPGWQNRNQNGGTRPLPGGRA